MIITSFLHDYCMIITSLLRSLLLHYYYVISTLSLLNVATLCSYILLQIHYNVLLRDYYIIIT